VTLKGFKNDFHLNASQWEGNSSGLANRNAWITSTAVLGAAFGALFSLLLNNRLGRLRAWRAYVAWWAVGVVSFAPSNQPSGDSWLTFSLS
jgi:hypothetical protein